MLTLGKCTQYPLSDWSKQLGVTPPAPATAAAGAASGASAPMATAAQHHSMAYQLKQQGFEVGSFCAVKEEEPRDAPKDAKKDAKQVPLRVWEITEVDDSRITLKCPNRAHHPDKDDTITVPTEEAVVKRRLMQRATFKRQKEVTPVGVVSPKWEEDIAIDIARRAVKAAHDKFVGDLEHVQVFAVPAAARVTCDYKRGELVLVASSNRFAAKPIGGTAKKDKQSGVPLGNISQHEVFLLKHVVNKDDEKEGKDGKNDKKDGKNDEKEVWQVPYWSVPEHESVHNMKHTTHSVEVPTITGTMCTVAVPTMTNLKGLKKGDYLVVQPHKRKREE